MKYTDLIKVTVLVVESYFFGFFNSQSKQSIEIRRIVTVRNMTNLKFDLQDALLNLLSSKYSGKKYTVLSIDILEPVKFIPNE